MRRLLALTVSMFAALPWPASAATAPVCEVRSGATPPMVVELYTSEGCSSCPPADRWLSTLKGRANVLPLAFHVTYWDRLGWHDRFASHEATERQYALAQAMSARNVYTPQVVAHGRDWRRWPQLPSAPETSAVALTLARSGQTVTATITATGSAGSAPVAAYSGYWAVLEDGHVSRVAAGENRGETLHHDHVVRLYRPVPTWPAGEARRFTLDVLPGEPAHPRRVVFVVEDPATRRPLQALALGC